MATICFYASGRWCTAQCISSRHAFRYPSARFAAIRRPGASKQVADIRDNFPANQCEDRSQEPEEEIAQRKTQSGLNLGQNVIAENRAGHRSRHDGCDIKSWESILHRRNSLPPDRVACCLSSLHMSR